MLYPITIQLSDNSGKPTSGKVEVQVRGSQLSAELYEDEAGTTPITMPAPTSSVGSFLGWLPAGAYNWRATNSQGDVLPWRPVNIGAVGSGEGEPGPEGPPG